jgi:uncharacterized membrane protein YkoI
VAERARDHAGFWATPRLAQRCQFDLAKGDTRDLNTPTITETRMDDYPAKRRQSTYASRRFLKFGLPAMLLGAACAPSLLSAAEPRMQRTKAGIEACIEEALRVRQGDVIRVELKQEGGVPVYEFDIESADGSDAWDVECSGDTGKIVEVEEEVTPDEARFRSLSRISEDQARRTALEKYPGRIVAVEYELEPNGSASYEFDVEQHDGKRMKVEVDIQSGSIVEASHKLFELGSEREASASR